VQPAFPELSKHLYTATEEERLRVEVQMKKSIPHATVTRLWRVQKPDQWDLYQAQLQLVRRRCKADEAEQFLWHSSGDTDPLKLVNSADASFDPLMSGLGEYGYGSYFSKHAVYGDLVKPCRFSKLYYTAKEMRSVPNIGEDILAGKDHRVYHVEKAADEAQFGKNAFHLRELRWNEGDMELTREERLSNPAKGGTGPWRSADIRFILLARVAVGDRKDYGSKFCISCNAAPPNYQSWGGTEKDFQLEAINERLKFGDYSAEIQRALDNGAESGWQVVVPRHSQSYPAYVVEYRSPREALMSSAVSTGGKRSRKQAAS